MFKRTLTSLLAAALVFAVVVPAYAQTKVRPYVVAGWTIGPRGTDTDPPVPEDPVGVVNGISFGGGVALTKKLGIEGSVGWTTAGETYWLMSYAFAASPGDRLTTDSDTHVGGLVRWSEDCIRWICPDFVAGGGFNSHRVKSIQVTSCPLASGTCTPVNKPEPDPDHREYFFTGGVDFRVRLGGGLDLLPGLRIRQIFRQEYLTGWEFRGPDDTDGAFFTFGVSAIYRF